MRRWWLLLILAGMVCMALGCVPRRLFWSPDGRHGAVIGGDGSLYLCDPAGKLSNRIAPQVARVAWFPDSKRFVAARIEPTGKWEEVQELLTEQRRKELIARADQLRAEILAHQGKWEDFKPASAQGLTPGEVAAMFLYVRDHRSQGLAQKMGDEWATVSEWKADICRLQVYEVTGTAATAGKTLVRLVDSVMDMRVSPNGELLAITTPMAFDSTASLGQLRLLSTQADQPPVLVAEQVSAYPDFSPNGAYLYYGATQAPIRNGKEDFTLGTLTRRRIADDNGRAVSPLPDPEDVVGVMFWSRMKVRCLRDGRVLFSSCEVSLPTTAAEMPRQVSLFSVDPSRQPTVTRMLPREEAAHLDGLGTGDFEVSPDEKRLVVALGTKGVAVLTLATGKVDVVIPAESAEDLLSMPAWRTADELALLAPPGHPWGSENRPELVLYALDGKTRVISRDWPPVLQAPAESQPTSGGPAK